MKKRRGLLVIPGYNAKIKRPSSLKVKYTNENKKDNIIDAEGLLATCIQHEIDHLNGILFIDHLSKLKKRIILKKAIKEYSKIKMLRKRGLVEYNIYGNSRFCCPQPKFMEKNYNIVAVYSQPARPSGRGMKTKLSPVEKMQKN